jgi:hypothetical protein
MKEMNKTSRTMLSNSSASLLTGVVDKILIGASIFQVIMKLNNTNPTRAKITQN